MKFASVGLERGDGAKLDQAFVWNVRTNLAGDGKGKGTSGSNREAEIPMRRGRNIVSLVERIASGPGKSE